MVCIDGCLALVDNTKDCRLLLDYLRIQENTSDSYMAKTHIYAAHQEVMFHRPCAYLCLFPLVKGVYHYLQSLDNLSKITSEIKQK